MRCPRGKLGRCPSFLPVLHRSMVLLSSRTWTWRMILHCCFDHMLGEENTTEQRNSGWKALSYLIQVFQPHQLSTYSISFIIHNPLILGAPVGQACIEPSGMTVIPSPLNMAHHVMSSALDDASRQPAGQHFFTSPCLRLLIWKRAPGPDITCPSIFSKSENFFLPPSLTHIASFWSRTCSRASFKNTYTTSHTQGTF